MLKGDRRSGGCSPPPSSLRRMPILSPRAAASSRVLVVTTQTTSASPDPLQASGNLPRTAPHDRPCHARPPIRSLVAEDQSTEASATGQPGTQPGPRWGRTRPKDHGQPRRTTVSRPRRTRAFRSARPRYWIALIVSRTEEVGCPRFETTPIERRMIRTATEPRTQRCQGRQARRAASRAGEGSDRVSSRARISWSE
jgi:hypothetical protein